MNPIDIWDLAVNLDDLLTAEGPGRPRFPLLVTRDGDPIAVIIRHEAYAPRLQDFTQTPLGDLMCHRCEPPQAIAHYPEDLAVAHRTANEHWRDTHQKRK